MDNLVPRQRMGGDKEPTKGNYTYLNHTLLSAEPPPLLLRSRPSAHMCVPAPLFCARPCVQSHACVCVCFFFFASVCVCGGGCEAVQSPGRTEWIYKLMEFKASSIDYHYNKQQHTECLIIFRQRFCALSSNSADAVTLSDICL